MAFREVGDGSGKLEYYRAGVKAASAAELSEAEAEAEARALTPEQEQWRVVALEYLSRRVAPGRKMRPAPTTWLGFCELCDAIITKEGKRWCNQCAPDEKALLRCLKYGLNETAYRTLVAQQERHCALCLSGLRLVVDQNGETGVIRGLLCYSCKRRVLKLEQMGLGRDADYVI